MLFIVVLTLHSGALNSRMRVFCFFLQARLPSSGHRKDKKKPWPQAEASLLPSPPRCCTRSLNSRRSELSALLATDTTINMIHASAKHERTL